MSEQPGQAGQGARADKAWNELIGALAQGQRAVGAAGLAGASRARLVARLVRDGRRPVVLVTPDEASAEAFARDLRFFLGPDPSPTDPRLLRVPANDVGPYDDLSPERTLVQSRLAALYHLATGTELDVVVLSAASLMRRVLPTRVIDAKSTLLQVDRDAPLDELARSLAQAGYENVPLVEDPGTFAVRGGILDVFSPLYPHPARLEFFGDTIESIRFFDPDTQRTTGQTTELSLCPAREVLFDDETRPRVVATIREAADEVSRPTAKVREFIEEVEQDVPAFGVEALLPGFWPEGLVPVTTYLPADALVVLEDPLALQRALDDLETESRADFEASRARGELSVEPQRHFLPADEALAWLMRGQRLELQTLVMGGLSRLRSSDGEDVDDELVTSAVLAAHGRVADGPTFGQAPLIARFLTEETSSLRKEILSHHGESGALEPLWQRLRGWRRDGLTGIVACHTLGQAEKLRRMLLDRDVMARLHTDPMPADPTTLYEPSVHAHVFVGEVSAGFVDRVGGLALVVDSDIFGERVERAVRKTKTEQPFAAAFRDLTEGDLVVHVDHGIARYEGLTRLQMRGIWGDFLVLQFAGKDKLYLPVHRLRQIQKYVGGDPEKVRLDSLQGQAFEKRKARVKEELLRMAAELLDLYAARKAHPGHAYAPPDEMYRQFEDEFEFEETPDQLKAIKAVLDDMQQRAPMDRLVCGDVGFGKTEVAMRAAFKAIEDRKQVAVLVPTTVLAAQHFRTFQDRMKDYPIVVDQVSRLKDSKSLKTTLEALAAGRVDVVVGTHRLLSSDVHFRDLGLVIIDEEHRFGVKHKEALKQYRRSVDVLTLTATPIPRTLHMSLSGVRDLSIIATPPTDRRAVRTFVTKFDPDVVKESIEREMARGGQVYFVHNRVESIEELRQVVAELVPKARIAVAHGQMPGGKLDEIMTAFVQKKYDVLVCTTIIESGLDIPSANTMLVNRADTFGLAQLYQIRGRVGRSRERAYCYLFVPGGRPLTKDARKRLQVLQQFTELGAGFHIASHDMEIRGAGNMLGPDQSGSIAAVGFDLYAELMDEAVRELRGEAPRTEIEPEVTLAVPAYIPDWYVPEVPQRLVFYKRLAQAPNDDDLYDIKAELEDRYGHAPDEVDNLVRLMGLKTQMRRMRLRALDSGPGRLVMTLGHDALLDPVRVAQLVARSKLGLRLTPEMKLVAPVELPKAGEPDWLEAAHRMLQALSEIRLPA